MRCLRPIKIAGGTRERRHRGAKPGLPSGCPPSIPPSIGVSAPPGRGTRPCRRAPGTGPSKPDRPPASEARTRGSPPPEIRPRSGSGPQPPGRPEHRPRAPRGRGRGGQVLCLPAAATATTQPRRDAKDTPGRGQAQALAVDRGRAAEPAAADPDQTIAATRRRAMPRITMPSIRRGAAGHQRPSGALPDRGRGLMPAFAAAPGPRRSPSFLR